MDKGKGVLIRLYETSEEDRKIKKILEKIPPQMHFSKAGFIKKAILFYYDYKRTFPDDDEELHNLRDMTGKILENQNKILALLSSGNVVRPADISPEVSVVAPTPQPTPQPTLAAQQALQPTPQTQPAPVSAEPRKLVEASDVVLPDAMMSFLEQL